LLNVGKNIVSHWPLDGICLQSKKVGRLVCIAVGDVAEHY